MSEYLKPAEIRKLSNKDLRRTYSRYRSIANARIKRLDAAGLGRRTKLFKKISEMSNDEIERELADASNWLRNDRTTVSGERKFIAQEIKDLQDRGYDFINQNNIYDFIDFMEEHRLTVGKKMHESNDAVDVFNEGQRLKIPPEVLKKHFDYFSDNIDKMEKVKPIKTDRAISFSDIKRKMNRL